MNVSYIKKWNDPKIQEVKIKDESGVVTEVHWRHGLGNDVAIECHEHSTGQNLIIDDITWLQVSGISDSTVVNVASSRSDSLLPLERVFINNKEWDTVIFQYRQSEHYAFFYRGDKVVREIHADFELEIEEDLN